MNVYTYIRLVLITASVIVSFCASVKIPPRTFPAQDHIHLGFAAFTLFLIAQAIRIITTTGVCVLQ